MHALAVAVAAALVVAACSAGRPTEPSAGASAGDAKQRGTRVPLLLWNEEQKRNELRVVDPTTGKEVTGHAAIAGGWPSVFSADGRKLATHQPRGQACEASAGGTACRGGAGVLHVIDLPDWRDRTLSLPAKGWVGTIAFSPDAARVAVVTNDRDASTVMIADTKSGRALAERTLDVGFRPSLVAYQHDGAALAVYGQPLGSNPGMTRPAPPRAILLDGATLSVLWDTALPDVVSGHWCIESCDASHEQVLFASWTPAVVPSPDGRKLYIVHADMDRLTTVDFGARAVMSAGIRAERSWLEQVLGAIFLVADAKGGSKGARKIAAPSPDGKVLYVSGVTMDATRDGTNTWKVKETALGLRVIDLASAAEIARREDVPRLIDLGLTPGGGQLLLHVPQCGVQSCSDEGPWTEVIDPASLKSVTRISGWEVIVSRRLDGATALLAMRREKDTMRLGLVDARSFGIVHTWAAAGNAAWIASP